MIKFNKSTFYVNKFFMIMDMININKNEMDINTKYYVGTIKSLEITKTGENSNAGHLDIFKKYTPIDLAMPLGYKCQIELDVIGFCKDAEYTKYEELQESEKFCIELDSKFEDWVSAGMDIVVAAPSIVELVQRYKVGLLYS